MTTPNVVSLPAMPTPLARPDIFHRVRMTLTQECPGEYPLFVINRSARAGAHAFVYGIRSYGCETPREAADRLRQTPAVAAVLDYVRRTGTSAVTTEHTVSAPVMIIADEYGLSPLVLQMLVNEYAAAMATIRVRTLYP